MQYSIEYCHNSLGCATFLSDSVDLFYKIDSFELGFVCLPCQ